MTSIVQRPDTAHSNSINVFLCRPTTISRTFQSLLWLQMVIITGTEPALYSNNSHRAFYGPLYYTCNSLRAILPALAVYTFRSFLLQRMRKPFAIEYREYLFNVLRTQPRAFVEGIFEVPLLSKCNTVAAVHYVQCSSRQMTSITVKYPFVGPLYSALWTNSSYSCNQSMLWNH